jgi:hypothetical protein
MGFGSNDTGLTRVTLGALPAVLRKRKAPAGGNRPGRAVQDRACRIGSDAARLGRFVLTIRQRRTRDPGACKGLPGSHIRRMGSCWGPESTPIQPAEITPARALAFRLRSAVFAWAPSNTISSAVWKVQEGATHCTDAQRQAGPLGNAAAPLAAEHAVVHVVFVKAGMGRILRAIAVYSPALNATMISSPVCKSFTVTVL